MTLEGDAWATITSPGGMRFEENGARWPGGLPVAPRASGAQGSCPGSREVPGCCGTLVVGAASSPTHMAINPLKRVMAPQAIDRSVRRKNFEELRAPPGLGGSGAAAGLLPLCPPGLDLQGTAVGRMTGAVLASVARSLRERADMPGLPDTLCGKKCECLTAYAERDPQGLRAWRVRVEGARSSGPSLAASSRVLGHLARELAGSEAVVGGAGAGPPGLGAAMHDLIRDFDREEGSGRPDGLCVQACCKVLGVSVKTLTRYTERGRPQEAPSGAEVDDRVRAALHGGGGEGACGSGGAEGKCEGLGRVSEFDLRGLYSSYVAAGDKERARLFVAAMRTHGWKVCDG